MNAEGIMLAVGAVIQDVAGNVLLVRHKPEREGYWKGKWICPGGKLHAGETLAEGALREIREETHLDVKLGRMLPPFETIVREQQECLLHVVYVDFLATPTAGELLADDDIGEAEWWSPEEVEKRWEELHFDTRRLLLLAGLLQPDSPDHPVSSTSAGD
ncbi:MAG: NUDIX domain-containing protein [Candidatus Abyssobacteria bacterium SURF_5]|uniref:NUDIX domain-containing protein n=1 Tax=Abyssobacteria bacterium (strain SURF_5) TaxID=2093360 RepID=A0A3A4P0Y9_ABYX5|nr:MAG: NUDIX domain-containing protein [Candidatus Abyssubacteria bacterium SURF_5]